MIVDLIEGLLRICLAIGCGVGVLAMLVGIVNVATFEETWVFNTAAVGGGMVLTFLTLTVLGQLVQ